MTIDNFRILKLDPLNLTFEEYRKVESRNKVITQSTMKWVRVGGYYGRIDQCLDALKYYIISNYANEDGYNDVLNKIKNLHNAIVECRINESESRVTKRISDDDL